MSQYRKPSEFQDTDCAASTFHQCEQEINRRGVTSRVECDESYVIDTRDDDGEESWIKTETSQKLELVSDMPSLSVRNFGQLRSANLLPDAISTPQEEAVGGPSAQVAQMERLLRKLSADVTGSIGREFNEDFVRLVSLVRMSDDVTLRALLDRVNEEADLKYGY